MFSALQIAKTLFIFQTSSSLSCLLWSSLLHLHCFFFSSKRHWPPSSCPTTIASCFNKLLLLFHATLQQPMQQVSVLPLIFSCLGFLFVEKALFIVFFLDAWWFPISFANEANLWRRCFTECVSLVPMVFREVS